MTRSSEQNLVRGPGDETLPVLENFGDRHCFEAYPYCVSSQVVRSSQVEAFGHTATFSV